MTKKIEGSFPEDSYLCDSCKHDTEPWDSEACDGCCKAHSGYEPEDSSTDCISPEIIEDIRNEIMLTMDECEPACKSQNNFRGGLFIALNIIDKYISGKENHERNDNQGL